MTTATTVKPKTTTPTRTLTKAEIARQLGVSRTYITLLSNGKRQPSKALVDKLTALRLTANLGVNTGAFEFATFNQGVAGSRPARPTTFRQTSHFRGF